jgi:hypothetical protein
MVLAAAFALLSGGAALAEDPIATAPVGGAGAPPTAAASTDASGSTSALSIPPEPQPMAMGMCGPQKVKDDGTLETAPHGAVEVGVGTGGYRHVGATVCQPIGQNGALAVSISDTKGDFGSRWGGRRGRGARFMGGPGAD